jgi:hypothetical protein
MGHPQKVAAGPPVSRPYQKRLKMPVVAETKLKAIAKVEKKPSERCSSCS